MVLDLQVRIITAVAVATAAQADAAVAPPNNATLLFYC